MMKPFRLFAGGVLAIIIIAALVLFVVVSGGRKVVNAVSEDKKQYIELVGRSIVLDKDTVEVVDYSTIQENVTLSNGKTVNIEYAKKKVINERNSY